MPKMTFILRDGTRKEVDAPIGLSVLEIAHRNDVDIVVGQARFVDANTISVNNDDLIKADHVVISVGSRP